jgi:hypothetical protein
MAGRRLSSNDVGVVIALAIVVLVLLLVYIAERREVGADRPFAVNRVDALVLGGDAVARQVPRTPDGDAHPDVSAEGCGVEPAQVGQSEPNADAVVERQREEAVAAILAALETRSEPRARAAGLWFRAARGAVDTVHSDACKLAPGACAAFAQRRLDNDESTEALARLAVNSSDPQVYAWAYRSCARVSRQAASSCQLVNALQWARLDPENAVPWLAVAQEAKARKDPVAVDDAMFHVGAATIHDPGWGRVAGQMIEAAPRADENAAGTWLAALSAMEHEAALELPSFGEVSTYCDARVLGNANRRDTCDKLAAVLVDRSTILLGRSMGIDLAKRLDWPAPRLAAAELERDAANALALRDAPQFGDPTTCAHVRSDLSRLVDNARLGEVEAVKQRIAAMRESIDTLAAEQRRFLRSVPEANAAAAAVPAASAATGG